MFYSHLSRQHFGPRLGFNTPISGVRVLNSVVYRGSLRCYEAAVLTAARRTNHQRNSSGA